MKPGKKQILCICGGLVCFAAARLASGMEDVGKTGSLPRNPYGGGETQYELFVEGLVEEDYPITVPVGERQYTEEQAEALFDSIAESLGERVRGDNPSLAEVRTDLDLITSLPEEGVTLDWASEDPDLMDSSGHIKNTKLPEGGSDLWLKTIMKAGEFREEYEIRITVFPPYLSEEERAIEELKEEIARQEESQRTEETLILPTQYGGRPLRYYDRDSGGYEILPVLGVLLAALFYVRDKMETEEEKKRRNRALFEDYSEIVFKLMVFISAGLTVLNAWERLVLDYQNKCAGGKQKLRPAYEEMADTLYQIRSGIPEGQAYTEFGKRCQLQPYIKLSSLLEQNRKTGTKHLKQLLEQEMNHAWEDQKNMARRLGEEAGTKLLLPLFLMLGIIMVIIMVPAMMSMM